MISSILYSLKNLHGMNAMQLISFLFGLFLMTAIPYSAGFCNNWYFQIGESYRLSFFYVLEFTTYSFILLKFGFSIKNNIEKMVFAGIIATLIARILSLVFASQMQMVQVFSLVRYIEVLTTLYCLTSLWQDGKNRMYFIAGLFLAALNESIMGYILFVYSGGFVRGIFTGVPAYQILVFFSLLLILESKKEEKWKLISLISLLFLGIVATQTRSALLQLIIGVMVLLFWALKKRFFVSFIIVSVIPVALVSSIFYLQGSLLKATTSRLAEAYQESYKQAETEQSVGTGTVQWRYFLWDKSLGAFLSHPITGIGSGGFPRQLVTLPQVFGVKLERVDKNNPLSSHNTFLGVLAETGLVGLVGYLIWIGSVIWVIIYSFRANKEDTLTHAICLMLCIFIFSDFWSQQSFVPNMTFFVAFLLGKIRENPATKI